MNLTQPLATLIATYPEAARPALTHQLREWSAPQPLRGRIILDATPFYRNTLVKHAALLAAGAELWVGTGRAMPADPTLLAQLDVLGLQRPTAARLAQGFDVVLDCAGAFADVPATFGYAELTHSGAAVYARKAAPVMLVDEGRIKTFETALGTGEGLLRALRHLGYEAWEGKRVVVFGCGKVGRGILFHCVRAGMEAWVVDPGLEAKPPQGVHFLTGRERAPLEVLLACADLVVCATGVRHALKGMFAPELLIGAKALLANMGVEDEFGEAIPPERVLNAKRPLNFILDEPTEMRYIDPTMALHNAAALRLIDGLPPGIHRPSDADEAPIFRTLPQTLLAELEAFEQAQE